MMPSEPKQIRMFDAGGEVWISKSDLVRMLHDMASNPSMALFDGVEAARAMAETVQVVIDATETEPDPRDEVNAGPESYWRKARGAVVAPGAPPAEDVIRRLRESDADGK